MTRKFADISPFANYAPLCGRAAINQHNAVLRTDIEAGNFDDAQRRFAALFRPKLLFQGFGQGRLATAERDAAFFRFFAALLADQYRMGPV
ncbi:hypothetical protein [Erythrobacter sp. MTPC3]|uniref:hypothetical protein n=1 Tax=Erythrobacter sp. MTPC3 TaxID=3056564 RepID=UPI0036F1ADB7